MNLTLTGFSGTGKTTICKLLAKRLGKRLISTDGEVVKKTKLGIEKFVKKYGWEKLQDVEVEIIEMICNLDECIFDISGGVVLRNENIVNLKKNSLVILLTADTETIIKGVKSSEEGLALANHLTGLKGVLQECENRCKKAADYTFDTSNLSPEEVCDLIIHYMQAELH